VHSIYYFSVAEFVGLVKRYGKALVVCHEFLEPVINYHGEASGTVSADGTVHMQVVGCATTYVHPAPHWLLHTSGHDGVIWTKIVTDVGFTAIYEARVGESPMLGVLAVNDTPLNFGRVVGNHVYLHSGKPFPAHLYRKIIFKAVSLPRTQAGFEMLCNQARQILAADEFHDCNIYEVCAAATNVVVKQELAALPTIDKEQLAELVTLKESGKVLQESLVNSLLIKVVLFCTLFLMVLGIDMVTGATLVLILALWWVSRNTTWLVRRCKELLIKRVIYPAHDVAYGSRRLAIYAIGKLSPLPLVAWMKFKPSGRKERHYGAVRYGPFTAIRTPVVHADTMENEEVALANRALSVGFGGDEDLWEAATHEFIDYLGKIGVFDVPIKPWDFEVWNRRFPVNRRCDHVRAFAHVQQDYTRRDINRWVESVAFIKREKLFVEEDSDPRLIQGTTPYVSVLLGPSMCAVSSLLSEKMAIGSPLVYAPGLNANQLGSFLTEAPGGNFSGLLLEIDFSRFDRSRGAKSLECEFLIYRKMGLKSKALECLNGQLVTKGRSSFGFRYGVPGTMKSGVPNTTVGNTLTSMLVTRYIFGKFKQPFRAMFGGDDIIVAVDDFKVSPKAIELEYERFGLKAKMSHHGCPYTASFYSGTFTPSTSGLILVPKLGTLFSKMCWSVSPVGHPKGWLKGVVLANLALYRHLPDIWHYLRIILDLVSDAQAVSIRPAHYNVAHASEACDVDLYYAMRYNINEDDRADFAVRLTTLSLDTDLSDWPFVRKCLAVDE